MRARFINEEWYDDFEIIVNDIFGIWDKYEDDGRVGIQKRMIGWPGFDESLFVQFDFPNGCSNEFRVNVDEYLKNYKIKHFGEIYPFEWNWKIEDFQHDALIIKSIE